MAERFNPVLKPLRCRAVCHICSGRGLRGLLFADWRITRREHCTEYAVTARGCLKRVDAAPVDMQSSHLVSRPVTRVATILDDVVVR